MHHMVGKTHRLIQFAFSFLSLLFNNRIIKYYFSELADDTISDRVSNGEIH